VKREFVLNSKVYNEFLDIMKKFKTHAIDTPGVMEHVSKLFRGNNKLILGFNTFLPDGFKIDLKVRTTKVVENRVEKKSKTQ
jgi:paired amphipathic helix protein Sin3a